MKEDNRINELIPELSLLLKSDEATLVSLVEVMDYTKCRNLLILSEYRSLTKEGVLPNKEVVKLLMKRYNISKASVHHVVYKTTLNKPRHCKNCETKMTKYMFGKNAGVCDSCLSA